MYLQELFQLGDWNLLRNDFLQPHLRGVTKKKRDCCHENFNTTFIGKLQIVPFKVVPL